MHRGSGGWQNQEELNLFVVITIYKDSWQGGTARHQGVSPAGLASSSSINESINESSGPKSTSRDSGNTSCTHSKVPRRVTSDRERQGEVGGTDEPNLLAAQNSWRCNDPSVHSTGRPLRCGICASPRRSGVYNPAAWAPLRGKSGTAGGEHDWPHGWETPRRGGDCGETSQKERSQRCSCWWLSISIAWSVSSSKSFGRSPPTHRTAQTPAEHVQQGCLVPSGLLRQRPKLDCVLGHWVRPSLDHK